jgi:ribose 5-phosphate isomerase B
VKIAIGSDHGGYELKEMISELLSDNGHHAVDTGCYSRESVDYPEFADKVVEEVRSGRCSLGILVCGTGIGMSMAANRHRDIRAALCFESYSARMSREHNNANVLCLGGRVIGPAIAMEIVRVWITTQFAGGRHQRRLDMLC